MIDPFPKLFERQDDNVTDAIAILNILHRRVCLNRIEYLRLKECSDSSEVELWIKVS